jgi:hypothetical protein
MRYADAPHVDLSNYYMRQPRQGASYRWMGYLCLAMAVLWANDPFRVTVVLGAVLFLWLQAWYRGVGGLWRSTLVAALVACAVILSWHKIYPSAPVGTNPCTIAKTSGACP